MESTQLDNVVVEIDAPVAVIILNRPDAANGVTPPMVADLFKAFEMVSAREDVRAVVLTGNGPIFCAGAKLDDFGAEWRRRDALPAAQNVQEMVATMEALSNLVRTIRNYPYPVIAAVNGPAAGGGCALAAAADMRIASPTARIGSTFIKVGVSSAAMGGSYLLPRLVGLGRALEMLITGDLIEASEAERYGLYNRVVPAESLRQEALTLASRCAALPPLGVRATKRAVNTNMDASLDQALTYEAQLQGSLFCTQDHYEGIQAFLEKREPVFTGC